ncbi:hypothetical protein GCM10009092_13010 [Bowmanella denitrificans]|uniref:Metallo-beta-lactamase domain-containing protein n=1 Tax=Bowmanella denitrificans TaxID=366582 RepID=A0ABN0WY21_9ALTE
MKLLCLTALILLCGCDPDRPAPQNAKEIGAIRAPYTGERFFNPHIQDQEKTVFAFLLTKYFGDVPFADQASQTDRIVVAPRLADLHQPTPYPRVTWLGHASFLISYQNTNLLTDPIFSERASPVSFAGPRRLAPLPYKVEQLPPIQHVLISHNHYDHLDKHSILSLGTAPIYHVPLGLKDWFTEIGLPDAKVLEYDWWQQQHISGIDFIATPTQHWSARSLFDRRKTLWAGWRVNWQAFSLWFAGDTGYNPIDFVETANKLGSVDLALIPIGAYAPREFMRLYHVTPTEALQIHQDIQANLSIGMHWSTFQLSAEDLDEPARLLEQARRSCPDTAPFITLAIGESRVIER